MEKSPIHLRKPEKEDASQIARLMNNRNIWNNLRDFVPHPYQEKDALEFISNCQNEDPSVTFAIEYESQLCGVIGLILQKDVFRVSAELGFWIGEPYWGRGIATAAIKEMVNYGFKTFDLRRMYAGVFEGNIGSMRALEKAGFEKEAVLKNAIIKNNQILHLHQYAIVGKGIVSRS